MARPLAVAARQPRAPQLLQISSTPGIFAWPMSPSTESEPRSTSPSMITDEPTPVPTLTNKIKWASGWTTSLLPQPEQVGVVVHGGGHARSDCPGAPAPDSGPSSAC